jgi:hypothetical protein
MSKTSKSAAASATGINKDINGVARKPAPPPNPALEIPRNIIAAIAEIQKKAG